MISLTSSHHALNRAGFDEWPSLRLYRRECGQQSFSVANLIYLRSEANYTWLNWNDDKPMLMPRTLKFYEPKLPAHFFLRLHRNCLVNVRYIAGAERDKTGPSVVLINGERLPISRRRWPAIKQMLDAQIN